MENSFFRVFACYQNFGKFEIFLCFCKDLTKIVSYIREKCKNVVYFREQVFVKRISWCKNSKKTKIFLQTLSINIYCLHTDNITQAYSLSIELALLSTLEIPKQGNIFLCVKDFIRENRDPSAREMRVKLWLATYPTW